MAARITEAGLAVRRGQVIPWDHVFAVDWTRRGAWVAIVSGMVWVSRATAAEVERRIAPWLAELPEAACPVPLAPGESVVVETDRASELSSLGLATLPTLAVSGLVEGWR
ncbi:MAG: hypothetical protein HZB16_04495, partial [Armatimonadetes bacterium]|nr:hypothetical protein [Armatimonadota bacterium]